MSDDIVLEVNHLDVAYQEKTVLQQVTLQVKAGTMTAIVGPNGAGKSTFIKAILALIPNVSGEISFFGKPYKEVSKKIGYVPQRATIDWDFPISAIEVVLMGIQKNKKWYERYSKQDRQCALDALTKVGMEKFANRHIKQLSGGQQQKVFLARALVEQAELYILDEPLVGIDKVTESIMIDILHELVREGKTIIVVHHDLNTIRTYFDHIIMLNQTLIAMGDIASVFTKEHIKQTFTMGSLEIGDVYVSV